MIERTVTPQTLNNMNSIELSDRRKFIKAGGIVIASSILATAGRDELFGDDGFEKMVDKVAGIEKQLGIYELAQFTPRI